MVSIFGAALVAVTVATQGCGGGSAPAPQSPSTAGAASGPAAAATSEPKAADPASAETCLATANAKRAKFSGEPAKVTVKHVLVKFAGAKNAAPDIKRTREQACLRAIEARDKLRGGADFDAIVKEYSEEPGAATRGGSIGAIERKDVLKPFADAAFELSVNQLSDVVETDFGFHVILRTE